MKWSRQRYLEASLIAALLLACLIPESFLFRWICLLVLSASLVLLLALRLGSKAFKFRPEEVYVLEEPLFRGELSSLGRAIARASRGLKLSRALVRERIVEALALDISLQRGFSAVEARELILKNTPGVIADDSLRRFVTAGDKAKGKEYLDLLSSVVEAVSNGGALHEG